VKDGLQVIRTLITQVIYDAGNVHRQFTACGYFTIQHAERIRIVSDPATLAEFRDVRRNCFLQGISILRSASGTADGIDLEREIAYAQGSEILHGKRDHLSIYRGISGAEGFQTDLVMLSVSAGLGSLITENAGYVVELTDRQSLIAVEFVLQVGADKRRSSLRAQRHAPLATIQERVHLFAYDIRVLADTPREEISLLKGGRAKLIVTIESANLSKFAFNVLPTGTVAWEDIGSSPR
jgi:hypothetical protein